MRHSTDICLIKSTCKEPFQTPLQPKQRLSLPENVMPFSGGSSVPGYCWGKTEKMEKNAPSALLKVHVPLGPGYLCPVPGYPLSVGIPTYGFLSVGTRPLSTPPQANPPLNLPSDRGQLCSYES